jgi:hypothetical protein
LETPKYIGVVTYSPAGRLMKFSFGICGTSMLSAAMKMIKKVLLYRFPFNGTTQKMFQRSVFFVESGGRHDMGGLV